MFFDEYSCNQNTDKWSACISRQDDLYKRSYDVRSPFMRDYTRILHSLAYRRLKHKTQVFFNIDNDHICTRMEHVAHVESVSFTIANTLGLNTDLTRAIAIGHDIGHAPFGHHGEVVLDKLSKKNKLQSFWHERNGLRFVDDLELLSDPYDNKQNLNLTYAVRDGMISHNGEGDQQALFPRSEVIDLEKEFLKKGQCEPYTWEGCVVKISDKIAYLGRDIEDALCLGFLNIEQQEALKEFSRTNDINAVNTTVIMNNLIGDICQNSSPETGICLSDRFYQQLIDLKKFNYKYIYSHKKLKPFKEYGELVLNSIYDVLMEAYEAKHTFENLSVASVNSRKLSESFSKWIARYVDASIIPSDDKYKPLKELSLNCKNKKIYEKLQIKGIYAQAIIDFLSGMTDRYAVEIFDELISYGD